MKLALAVFLVIAAMCLGASAQTSFNFPSGMVILQENWLGGTIAVCWEGATVTGFFSDFGSISGTRANNGREVSGNVLTAGANANGGSFSMVYDPSTDSFKGALALESLPTGFEWEWSGLSSTSPRVLPANSFRCWSGQTLGVNQTFAALYEDVNADGDVTSTQSVCYGRQSGNTVNVNNASGSFNYLGHNYYLECDTPEGDPLALCNVWRVDYHNGILAKSNSLYNGIGIFSNEGSFVRGYVWNVGQEDVDEDGDPTGTFTVRNALTVDDPHYYLILRRAARQPNGNQSSKCNRNKNLKDGKVPDGPKADYTFTTPYHREEDFTAFDNPFNSN